MGATMRIRCCQCKAELPEGASREWGYKLANHMYFCSYSCMMTKQRAIQEKQAETYARKKAEKEAKAAARRVRPVADQNADKLDGFRPLCVVVDELSELKRTSEEEKNMTDQAKAAPAMQLITKSEAQASATMEQPTQETNPPHEETTEELRETIRRKNEQIIEQEQLIAELQKKLTMVAADASAYSAEARKYEKRVNSLLATVKTLIEMLEG